MGTHDTFSRIARRFSLLTGSPQAFAAAAITIVLWAICGPYFGFSDTWQLVINTGTTIITFLMVFLIQNSQNHDAAALQLKLDELILAGKTSNRFVGLEQLTAEEIEGLRRQCLDRAQRGR